MHVTGLSCIRRETVENDFTLVFFGEEPHLGAEYYHFRRYSNILLAAQLHSPSRLHPHPRKNSIYEPVCLTNVSVFLPGTDALLLKEYTGEPLHTV